MQFYFFSKTSKLLFISRQFSFSFSWPFLGKMNRGERSSIPIGNSSIRCCESQLTLTNNSSNTPEFLHSSDPANDKEWPSLSASNSTKNMNKRKTKIDLKTHAEERSVDEPEESTRSSQFEASHIANYTSQNDETSLPTSFGKKFLPSTSRRQKLSQTIPPNAVNIGNSDSAEANGLPVHIPFDICFPKHTKSFLNVKNRKKWVAKELRLEENAKVLGPGIVLLKAYISLSEQVEIIRKCRDLGLGRGGFYQPFYRDGAKLRLQMMCLGLNWDPETRSYEHKRPFDGSETPGIPLEFSLLVERAIRDSQDKIEKELRVGNVEEILPGMSPDICIVNFYSTTGRLGLHQDRDETKESREKGLPVVSFSVGDSAEFLYGDQRNVEKAEKVVLKSGDVLIFGGKSRHIFHGVQSIIPKSAPHAILEEAMLRPGRLNLTFRQY